MTIELKIKSKHLSEEARIIRFEENKLKRQIKWMKEHTETGNNLQDLKTVHRQFMSLKEHRRFDVRNENRATYLARAFLAGADYKSVEQKRKAEREYDFRYKIIPRVTKMVQKYGGGNHQGITEKEILEWVDKLSE